MNSEGEKAGEALKRVPLLSPDEVPRANPDAASDCGNREADLLGRNLSLEDIKAIAAKNEHGRNENFRDHFERIAICGLWLSAVVLFLVGLTWFYHLVAPDGWHWLSDHGVDKVQNILTGTILSLVAGGHLKRRLGP